MSLYIETSCLVKLYLEEDGSDRVQSMADAAYVLAVSRVAYAEARSALARRLREGGLNAGEHRELVVSLDRSWDGYHVLDLTETLSRKAGELAEKHALRGFDAIHLASAMVFRDSLGMPVFFLSSDRKLSLAARKEGLKIS